MSILMLWKFSKLKLLAIALNGRAMFNNENNIIKKKSNNESEESRDKND